MILKIFFELFNWQEVTRNHVVFTNIKGFLLNLPFLWWVVSFNLRCFRKCTLFANTISQIVHVPDHPSYQMDKTNPSHLSSGTLKMKLLDSMTFFIHIFLFFHVPFSVSQLLWWSVIIVYFVSSKGLFWEFFSSHLVLIGKKLPWTPLVMPIVIHDVSLQPPCCSWCLKYCYPNWLVLAWHHQQSKRSILGTPTKGWNYFLNWRQIDQYRWEPIRVPAGERVERADFGGTFSFNGN